MKHESDNKFTSLITDPLDLKLIGCVYYGDPFHSAKEWTYDNEIGKLWTRFLKLCMGKYASFFKKIAQEPGVSYELHIETDEYADTKKYCIFVGIETNFINNQPLELFFKVLPRTQYLRFTTKADSSRDADHIMKNWLSTNSSQFKQNYPYILQRYDKRYKGLDDPDSIMEWMIPVSRISNKEGGAEIG